MGWKASMIIIENKEGFNNETELLATLGLSDFDYAGTTCLDECIFPGDDSVNIGHYNNNIIVCDDAQIIDDFISDRLSPREKELARLFPRSEILAVACISTTNFHGYAQIKNGAKVRVKALNADNGFYWDSGELMEEEKAIYEGGSVINGQRVWKFEDLPDDLFKEDQLMEDFTFGVAKRLLGVRIDHVESDQLMEEVVFKKYIRKSDGISPLPESVSMFGQWIGHFEYGPEYGEELAGEKVQFRAFIENFNNGEFEGKTVEVNGVGANFEQATVKGFLEGSFISFTKQYPHYYGFDENNNAIEDKSQAHPLVNYEGHYDALTKTFKGEWEMRIDVEPVGNGWMEEVCTGKWELRKDD
jgi:hypothetical protein